jgi:ketosteroid isomerase-like protein
MSNDLNDFKQFMRQREKAAGAYVCGDAEPLAAIAAEVSDATFFAPNGDLEHGTQRVLSRYQTDAENFEPDGNSFFEILQLAAEDGIAFWTGFQRATAHLKGKKEAVQFNLRVTEIFRREEGQWKLVHRHADATAEGNQR